MLRDHLTPVLSGFLLLPDAVPFPAHPRPVLLACSCKNPKPRPGRKVTLARGYSAYPGLVVPGPPARPVPQPRTKVGLSQAWHSAPSLFLITSWWLPGHSDCCLPLFPMELNFQGHKTIPLYQEKEYLQTNQENKQKTKTDKQTKTNNQPRQKPNNMRSSDSGVRYVWNSSSSSPTWFIWEMSIICLSFNFLMWEILMTGTL